MTAFPIHFLNCNILLSLLLGFLLLAKRALKRQITLSAQYHLWYLFVFSLFLPFVPGRIVPLGKLFLRLQELLSQRLPASVSALTEPNAVSRATAFPRLQDFSTAAASSGATVNTVLWGLWVAGMTAAALYLFHTMRNIYRLRKNAYRITRQTEPCLYAQFEACLHELHIKRPVRLYASCSLMSPISYGWLWPTVILPQDLDIYLSEKEIRFIFLHELLHYKHRDPLMNYLVCLLQLLYWFNPFIRYGFGQLQKDREIACDHSVISVIGEENCMNYGYTMIRYAGQMRAGLFFSPLSAMGGGTNTIRQRIQEIADYKKDTLSQRLKSIGTMALALLLVFGTGPLLTAHAASNSPADVTGESWQSIDLDSYFGDADGSFVLYDVTNDRYQIYNRKLSEQRVSPDSTFKIYSALFALEENIITPDSSLQKWDGSPQPFASWNRDQTLSTAMRDSVNWYFQDLDSHLGPAALYSYYQKISYGNCDLTGGIGQYWAESSLKISPVEQVMLLSDLLENKWNFKEQNIDAVKESLFLSDTPFGRLYGKTGSGSVDGENVNGWFVGFVEKGQNHYCFAANLQNSELCTGGRAAEITMDILLKYLR